MGLLLAYITCGLISKNGWVARSIKWILIILLLLFLIGLLAHFFGTSANENEGNDDFSFKKTFIKGLKVLPIIIKRIAETVVTMVDMFITTVELFIDPPNDSSEFFKRYQ